MSKPEVGQKVYKLNVGNNARRTEQKLTPVVVTRVGKKYFSVMEEGRPYTEFQVRLDDWIEKTEYSPGWAIYSSEQDYYDEKTSKEICKYIHNVFEYGNNNKDISLLGLKKIMAILLESKNE